jgi:hypothetical protein
MTAKIELNSTTSIATLTFTGPSDRWFALQIGSFASGGGMQEGTDVVYWNGTTLVDASQNGIGSPPSPDAVNDWTSSNTVSGTTRTIIATRAFSTGSAEDFTFVYSDINIDFAWAKGSTATNTLISHGNTRGYSLNNAYSCIAPGAPVASAQTLCSGATVASLVATGETGATFKWYAASTGGTALATTTALTATTYYVSQTVGECESTRTAVAVTLTTVPLPQTADTTPDYCSASTIAQLVVTGQAGATFTWYNEPANGTVLPTTTALVNGTHYYVAQTVNGCTSARLMITPQFVPVPLPTASEAQSFCSESHVSDLVATGQTGAVIKWYNVATGGDVLPGTTLLVAGNYYVSQTVGSCTSERKLVVVSFTTIPMPTASEAQSFCSESHVSDLVATGQTGAVIKWYSVATGGDVLPGTTLLVAGDYYVSQTVGPCVSNRKHVVVSYTTLAGPTVPNEIATVCSGSTLANLTVTGLPNAIFTWYENETGGNAIPTTTLLVDGEDYYVTQTVGACVSSRRKVTINIDELPIVEAEHNQSFCAGSTVADFVATGIAGAELKWRKTQDGPVLGQDAVLTAGVYYVTQTVNGCTSPVKEVIVTLLPAPAAPSGNASQEFNAGETVSDLTVGIIVGATVQWYIMDGGVLQPIGADHLLADGVDYYITQTVDGCESEPFKITANAVLGTPTFSIKSLVVYPNPVVDVLTVSYKETITEVTMVNMLGQVVISQKANSETVEVNTDKLQSGTYILKVATVAGSASVKIVK